MVDTVSKVVRRLREEGKTIVLIEHDMEVIKDLCDQVIVLDAGRKLAEGDPNAVLKKEKVKNAYLGT
jgi:ABC-type branched-subunit amino acid transport system ATPase component